MNIVNVDVFRISMSPSVSPKTPSQRVEFDTPLSRWKPRNGAAGELLVVRIETDSGIIGWGETIANSGSRALQAMIEDILAQQLIGADARHIAPLWEQMYASIRLTSGALPAIAAVDIALWDILGKHVGVPVARLLGAQVRNRVPLVASGFTKDTGNKAEDILKQVQDAVASGFTTVAIPPAGLESTNHQLFTALHKLDIKIAVDGRGTSDFATARRLGRLLEQYEVRWIESLLPPEHHHEGYRLAAFLDVPIVGGYDLTSRWAFQRALVDDAFDIAAPEIMFAGGISECRRIASLADTFGKPYKPAVTGGLGIGAAAALQLAAHTPNLMICEWLSTPGLHSSDTVTLGASIENGFAVLSGEPGLGITVDETALRQWSL